MVDVTKLAKVGIELFVNEITASPALASSLGKFLTRLNRIPNILGLLIQPCKRRAGLRATARLGEI